MKDYHFQCSKLLFLKQLLLSLLALTLYIILSVLIIHLKSVHIILKAANQYKPGSTYSDKTAI